VPTVEAPIQLPVRTAQCGCSKIKYTELPAVLMLYCSRLNALFVYTATISLTQAAVVHTVGAESAQQFYTNTNVIPMWITFSASNVHRRLGVGE